MMSFRGQSLTQPLGFTLPYRAHMQSNSQECIKEDSSARFPVCQRYAQLHSSATQAMPSLTKLVSTNAFFGIFRANHTYNLKETKATKNTLLPLSFRAQKITAANLPATECCKRSRRSPLEVRSADLSACCKGSSLYICHVQLRTEERKAGGGSTL